jgi:hypothetical protein
LINEVLFWSDKRGRRIIGPELNGSRLHGHRLLEVTLGKGLKPMPLALHRLRIEIPREASEMIAIEIRPMNRGVAAETPRLLAIEAPSSLITFCF